MSTLGDLEQRLHRLASMSAPPDAATLCETMEAATAAMAEQGQSVRPPDEAGHPGGLVYLVRDIPTVVVPDLHGRRGFIISLMEFSLKPWGVDMRLIDALAAAEAQLVFVGDYVHGEARAMDRWFEAYEEYKGGYRRRAAGDGEMTESLGVLMMVASLKDSFPGMVHGLKGNHENIANEYREGNYPFRKFVEEGAMVADYMDRFYPGAPVSSIYRFEKSLPLMAVGNRFLVSHAEPVRPFEPGEIVNGATSEEVVAGLTWTANGQAEPDSVAQTLRFFFGPDRGDTYQFGGHRPIESRYALRAQGRYVQLHNPERYIVAVLPGEGEIDFERDIEELPRHSDAE
ncbi:MAG: calcineurin [Alkalispirochaetaceae bacterium]